MKYPLVYTEDETIDLALAGRSLARYGDGELRVATGGGCVSQKADPKLARELTIILGTTTASLVCIPTQRSAKPKNWLAYAHPRYVAMMRRPPYGSAFVTRPDSAPWIDRPDYWDKIRSFWRGRDVVLVAGSERSLTSERMPEAASVRRVMGTYRDSYSVIDQIEEEVGAPAGPVIICLGCAGTVLAERLARRKLWALDLGHIGMMMKNAGTGRWDIKQEQLISKDYLAVLRAEHAAEAWGRAGKSHLQQVMAFAHETGSTCVLDYGCGTGTLGLEMRKIDGAPYVHDYDVGIPGKDLPPPARDLVVCTDVMEHVEPGMVDNVLRHIHNLALKAAYFTIALTPSERILNDGNNAHLTVREDRWWLDKIRQAGFRVVRHEMRKGLHVWCRK